MTTEKELLQKHREKLEATGIRVFPDEFTGKYLGKELKLPGKTLTIGENFFDTIEVVTVNGESFYQAEDNNTAKFIIYANRTLPSSVVIPDDKDKIKTLLKDYELYLSGIIKNFENDYKKNFPDGKNSAGLTLDLLRSFNLVKY